MRSRFALLALLAALLPVAAGCEADQALDQGVAGPATTAAAPRPTAAPSSTRAPLVAEAVKRPPPEGAIPPARRKPAPALSVRDFDGRAITMASFRGRPAVVNFFESWCPQCRDEQFDLNRVARRFHRQVGFVGVSYHDTVGDGRDYQRVFEVPYSLANDASGRTWGAWGVPYQPVTVVVDGQGRIARRFDGEVEAGELSEVLEYLVGA
jgi:peroxiredoxin